MDQPELEPDLLSRIPSPSRRLWVGLWIILSIFVVFALYAVHEVRWLEDFQVNVVQKNRKASLQLLRLQNDAYALAISLQQLARLPARYPIAEWRPEFTRLRHDMEDAARLESNYAITMSAAEGKRAQLRTALRDFWSGVDHAFDVADRGQEQTAQRLFQSEVESNRIVISEVLARLLVLNDQAQDEAAQRINSVYGSVKANILIVIALLSLLALGTGLYTLQANRKTFQRVHHLAERLQAQSEQLRKLSWKLIDVQEDTLRRVARDLHDEFGQILTAVGAMLTRAGRKTLAGNSEFVQELEAVKRIVEDTLQNVRDRSQMFRPAILDDFGLEQSLQSFVEQFSRQAGINVCFEGKCRDGVLPPEDAIHVYRIVQEALNNVARHSGASEAWVVLVEGDTGLKLEIRDNGNGFDRAAEIRRSGGVGLMGMQERAEHLGGCLTVQSAPGAGTVVTFAVPLKRTVGVAPIAS
jgi:signal transduction histidine kinase